MLPFDQRDLHLWETGGDRAANSTRPSPEIGIMHGSVVCSGSGDQQGIQTGTMTVARLNQVEAAAMERIDRAPVRPGLLIVP